MRKIVMVLSMLVACGGTAVPPPSAPPPTPTSGPSADLDAPRASPSGGSSDGVTCEQIRLEYIEEINVQGERGPADLTAEDFGRLLNQGSFLDACQVPTTSHAQICAAVRAGAAVGVTVALDPSDVSLEVCVARQIRAISFPSHPKTDFVTVRF
jgi:hypothetical protein